MNEPIQNSLKPEAQNLSGPTSPTGPTNPTPVTREQCHADLRQKLDLPPDAPYEDIILKAKQVLGEEKFQQLADRAFAQRNDPPAPGGSGGSDPHNQPLTGGSEAGPTRSQAGPDPAQPGSNPPPARLDLAQHRTSKILAALQEHSQSVSPIDVLPRDRQRALIALLEDFSAESVAQTLALPEPHGWNFQTSKSALNRFRRRYRQNEEAKQMNEVIDRAMQFLDVNQHDPTAITEATLQQLRLRLFEITSSPDCTINLLNTAAKILNDLRKQDLQERKHPAPKDQEPNLETFLAAQLALSPQSAGESFTSKNDTPTPPPPAHTSSPNAAP